MLNKGMMKFLNGNASSKGLTRTNITEIMNLTKLPANTKKTLFWLKETH